MQFFNEIALESIEYSQGSLREWDFIGNIAIQLEDLCSSIEYLRCVNGLTDNEVLIGFIAISIMLNAKSIITIIFNDPYEYYQFTPTNFRLALINRKKRMDDFDDLSNDLTIAPWLDTMKREWAGIVKYTKFNFDIEWLITTIIEISGGWPELMEPWFQNPQVIRIIMNSYWLSLKHDNCFGLLMLDREMEFLFESRPHLLKWESNRALYDRYITTWRYDYVIKYDPSAARNRRWSHSNCNPVLGPRVGNFFKCAR